MKKLIISLVSKLYGKMLNLYVIFNSKRAAKKAFHIFCKVRKGGVLANQKDYLDAAKHTTHNILGHSIQTYYWKGNGKTVMLVHGWESNTWRWHRLVQYLREADYTIVAFDGPGHGNSSGKYLHIPLYAEVLQSMIKIHSPKFLIGHSYGGMTILYNEYMFPSPITEKIVTIISPSEYHEIMSHFQSLLGFNNKVLSALDTYIQKRFGFSIQEFSTSRYAQSNEKKGLLFHDRFDKIAPYHASQRVHSQWKGSHLRTTEGLGHSMHQDEVNNQIVSFLAS
jgi:pimeloyl-ACP methyl ester carboxylesterase